MLELQRVARVKDEVTSHRTLYSLCLLKAAHTRGKPRLPEGDEDQDGRQYVHLRARPSLSLRRHTVTTLQQVYSLLTP